jgi:hypothetical protein
MTVSHFWFHFFHYVNSWLCRSCQASPVLSSATSAFSKLFSNRWPYNSCCSGFGYLYRQLLTFLRQVTSIARQYNELRLASRLDLPVSDPLGSAFLALFTASRSRRSAVGITFWFYRSAGVLAYGPSLY